MTSSNNTSSNFSVSVVIINDPRYTNSSSSLSIVTLLIMRALSRSVQPTDTSSSTYLPSNLFLLSRALLQQCPRRQKTDELAGFVEDRAPMLKPVRFITSSSEMLNRRQKIPPPCRNALIVVGSDNAPYIFTQNCKLSVVAMISLVSFPSKPFSTIKDHSSNRNGSYEKHR